MSDARLQAVLKAANDIAYEWDFETDHLIWYGPVRNLFDVPEPQVPSTGKALQKLIHPEDLPLRTQSLEEYYKSGESYESEFRLRRNGLFGWVHERAGAERDESGKPLKLLGIIRSIDERKHREATLRHSALYDSVTGQFNRSRLLDSVNEKLLQTRRYGSAACYLVVGLNSYAPADHNTEMPSRDDSILIAMSQHIESCLRASDVIGRVNKTEFGILITHCNPGDISIIAHKLLSRFRKRDVHTPEGIFHVELSVGGIMLPGCALTGFDVMNGAEHALAKAREEGNDTFHEFSWPDDVSREYHQAVPVGDRVLAALKEDRIEFAFQPIVDSHTGRTIFYEALLRLWDEDRNLIAAKDFIPAIEKLGYSRVIDRRTLDLAVHELYRSPDAKLALNISGVTVSDPAWLRKLNSHLRDRPDVAKRLTIEITETIAMKEMAQSVSFVNHVRNLGCKVALDDFGAGFITFRHLKTLTVDEVKIDGALIVNIDKNKDNQALVRTLVELARAFRLEIVAEFVETEEEAAFLRTEGVTYLQGYYYGKPSFERPWLSSAGTENRAMDLKQA
jgi:diguanylate cyclase (GGDEF)-like protein